MHDGEETDTMVEAFLNVFRYKLRSTVSGGVVSEGDYSFRSGETIEGRPLCRTRAASSTECEWAVLLFVRDFGW